LISLLVFHTAALPFPLQNPYTKCMPSIFVHNHVRHFDYNCTAK
jgi:hypothetical protein